MGGSPAGGSSGRRRRCWRQPARASSCSTRPARSDPLLILTWQAPASRGRSRGSVSEGKILTCGFCLDAPKPGGTRWLTLSSEYTRKHDDGCKGTGRLGRGGHCQDASVGGQRGVCSSRKALESAQLEVGYAYMAKTRQTPRHSCPLQPHHARCHHTVGSGAAVNAGLAAPDSWCRQDVARASLEIPGVTDAKFPVKLLRYT